MQAYAFLTPISASRFSSSLYNACLLYTSAIKRFISDNVIIGVKSYKDFFIFFRQMTKSEISDIMKKMYDAVARCKLTDEFGNTIETRSEAYSRLSRPTS